jgi:hypothetical protein
MIRKSEVFGREKREISSHLTSVLQECGEFSREYYLIRKPKLKYALNERYAQNTYLLYSHNTPLEHRPSVSSLRSK